MRLIPIEGNRQKLDGGAMYGNCPKAVWQGWSPPDAQNRIDLACRSLLVVEDSGRTVLLETGIGDFFEPKLKERYGVEGDGHVLLQSLKKHGFGPSDIDAVVLSHLHFDHAGGLLDSHVLGKAPSLVFSRAQFFVGKKAWERAKAPHPRDRASFIPEIGDLLEKSGRLNLVEPGEWPLGRSFRFHFSDGHTPGLMMAEVEGDFGPCVFASDLIPAAPWVHAPITMGYDRFPEVLIDEKLALMTELLGRQGSIYFTHDPKIPHGRLTRDVKGRFGVLENAGQARI